MTKNIDSAWKVAKEVTEIGVQFEIKGEPSQFTSSIAPIISNAIYNREKEILEAERWDTVRVIAITFPNAIFLDTMKELGYKLTK